MISAKSLSKNFAIQSTGKVLSVVIGLIIVAILTRALGPTGFGEYTTAVTFLQLFGVVVDFGLTLTLVVMISEKGADEKKVVGNIFSLRLLSAAILFALAPLAVLPFPWNNTIKLAIAIGAIAYFFMSGASLLIGIYQKHEAMWRAALAELINRIVLVGTIALLAYYSFGVIAMVAASILANIIWLFFMIRFAKRFTPISLSFDWQLWKKILSKSWPIALSVIFNLLYLKGDILFLAYFKDSAEVGYYGAAYRFIDVLTAIPVMFMGLLLPSLVHTFSSKNIEHFNRQVKKSFDLFMIFAIPAVIGTWAIAEPLIGFIAGEGYEPAAAVLRILIVAAIGVFAGALFGHSVVAINKQKQMIWGYASVALITIIGYLYLIPLYGMFGAAWMTIFSELLIALLTFVMVYKTTKVLPNMSASIKALIAAACMYAVLIPIANWHVLIQLIVAILVYGGIIITIGGVKLSELKALIARS